MDEIVKMDETTGVQINNVKTLQFRGRDIEPRHKDGKVSKIILLNARTVDLDILGYNISDDIEPYDCLAFERPVELGKRMTEEEKVAIANRYMELSSNQPKQQTYYLGYVHKQEDEYIFEKSEDYIENTAKDELKKMRQKENERILDVGRRKRIEEKEREEAMKKSWQDRISKARGE